MELLAIIIALIVPIGIAIWTVRSSAKDTAIKIAALEKSTLKQVDSVKELAKIQIEITSILMEKELWDARYRQRQTAEKTFNVLERHHSMLGVPYNEITSMIHERDEKEKNLSLEKDFYSKQVERLDGYLNRIKSINQKISID